MTSQIVFDLVLTIAACFSLVGLLAVAAAVLPWRDEELIEVEEVLVAPFRREGRASSRSAAGPAGYSGDRAVRRAA